MRMHNMYDCPRRTDLQLLAAQIHAEHLGVLNGAWGKIKSPGLCILLLLSHVQTAMDR